MLVGAIAALVGFIGPTPAQEKQPDPDKGDPPAGAFPHRSGVAKNKLLQEGGGNSESEAAVARGLAWLAKQQKDDGHWEYDGLDKKETAAATGMCLLPFLAAGQTPKTGKYQKAVAAGVAWLVKAQKPDGRFEPAATMYSQAIAAQALIECSANGSWGYQAGQSGDTSITGWQLQALRAARSARDLDVDDTVIKRAMRFLDGVAAGPLKGTRYGYTSPAGAGPDTSLTAVGLWARCNFAGWGPNNAALAEGVEGLLRRAPHKSTALDAYFHFYATQVLREYGGEEWKTWNEGPLVDGKRTGGMRDLLVRGQDRTGADAGRWEPDKAFIGRSCGRVGTTAMCVLTLEVYYRYAPLFPPGENPKP